MDSRKIVYKETLLIVIGEIVCIGLMFGIFALLKKIDTSVLLGGLIGGAVAIGNFFVMAIGTSLAADKAEAQDVKGGKALLQISFFARYVVMFVVLFAGAKSGYCNLVALLLPLVFVRPVLTLGEFFRKKEDTKL